EGHVQSVRLREPAGACGGREVSQRRARARRLEAGGHARQRFSRQAVRLQGVGGLVEQRRIGRTGGKGGGGRGGTEGAFSQPPPPAPPALSRLSRPSCPSCPSCPRVLPKMIACPASS